MSNGIAIKTEPPYAGDGREQNASLKGQSLRGEYESLVNHVNFLEENAARLNELVNTILGPTPTTEPDPEKRSEPNSIISSYSAVNSRIAELNNEIAGYLSRLSDGL